MSKPLVSICCITYNHENYIRDALDGFLMQKVDFPIEIIISDDCSTDNTRRVIAEYKKKYPKIIQDVSPAINLGMFDNFVNVLSNATGKYVAYCDGDDYWTDPLKLQKQVDILESDETIIVTSTDCSVVDVTGKRTLNETRASVVKPDMSGRYKLRDFFDDNHQYPTSTVVYRNNNKKEILAKLYDTANDFQGDWPFWICLMIYGDMYYLSDVTCAYRVNPTSVTHTTWSSKRVKRVKACRTLCRKIAKILPEEYADVAIDLNDIRWTWVPLMLAYRAEKRYLGMIGCLVVSLFVCPKSLWKIIKEYVRKKF